LISVPSHFPSLTDLFQGGNILEKYCTGVRKMGMGLPDNIIMVPEGTREAWSPLVFIPVLQNKLFNKTIKEVFSLILLFFYL